MANNVQTAPVADAPQSGFRQILSGFGSTVFSTLSDLTKIYAQGEVTRQQIKQDLQTQQYYDELSKSNHATNDPDDASKAAVEQTVLLFGFLPVSKSIAPLATLAFIAIGVLLTFALVKSVARR